MTALNEFTGSIISSLLGPNKNNKVIEEDDTNVYISRCALQVFQASHLQDSLCSLIEESLLDHHSRFGCSTLTLLALWHFWSFEFKSVLDEKYKLHTLIHHSQDILEQLISSLSEIQISFDSLFYPKKKRLVGQRDLIKQIPINICYSSRHFSPSLNNDASSLNEKKTIFDDPEEIKEKCYSIVKKLDHDGENGIVSLVSECWTKQCIFTKSRRFQVDGLHVLPLNIPCSNSTVIDGLAIKSNSHLQSVKTADSHRVLIVTGGVTFEYKHLGFSPKVSITTKTTPQNLTSSGKDVWLEKCCEKILKLQLDALLVRDAVEPAIVDFCMSHSVLVLPLVPWSALKILSKESPPCTYILDCSEDNMLNNLIISEWKSNNSTFFKGQLFVFTFNPLKKEPLQSILLCHPSSLTLSMLEHQVWHLISRLKSSSEIRQFIPGGGRVEEHCYNFLKNFFSLKKASGFENRVSLALASGFLSYSNLVASKVWSNSETALDDLPSKTSAWKTALQLVFLTLQCDLSIVNGAQKLSII